MQRKEKKNEKKIDGKGLKIGVVVAEFNWDITGKMAEGAVEFLKKSGVESDDIDVVKVPGAFELPLMCKKMVVSGKFDALVALGCVIKGDTDHYYYVAGEASRGIMDVMIELGVPIGFGVITTNNLEQAEERSSGKSNKGFEAAEAALVMVENLKKI
ncbi:MAG: 6,7-dimethyl-8-ribityllumazine synthase [Candidatus Moranbacteria bacterium]|nr:6,7-dimethyl-8-ribityllumazine synthase [Candidatus Moranbacteria bacterium]